MALDLACLLNAHQDSRIIWYLSSLINVSLRGPSQQLIDINWSEYPMLHINKWHWIWKPVSPLNSDGGRQLENWKETNTSTQTVKSLKIDLTCTLMLWMKSVHDSCMTSWFAQTLFHILKWVLFSPYFENSSFIFIWAGGCCGVTSRARTTSNFCFSCTNCSASNIPTSFKNLVIVLPYRKKFNNGGICC